MLKDVDVVTANTESQTVQTVEAPTTAGTATNKEPDLVPVALLRPLISPPWPGRDDDPPAYAFVNPYDGNVHVLSEEITILPFTYAHRSFPDLPIVLKAGAPIFVGRHLFRGHPDDLPDALWDVLESHFEEDWKAGRRHHWLASPPVRFDDVAVV